MNDNPRDTQFQCFATLVLKELLDVKGAIPIETFTSEVDEAMHTIIARRAYDLVKHTLQVAEQAKTVDEVIAYVPDFNPDTDKWPEVTDGR